MQQVNTRMTFFMSHTFMKGLDSHAVDADISKAHGLTSRFHRLMNVSVLLVEVSQ